MQIYHQLITELMPHLQDGMQHQRRVLAIYLSGSASRNMQNIIKQKDEWNLMSACLMLNDGVQ